MAIDALAQRLHHFGRCTEEREMELWHQLSSVVDELGVERLLARNQEIWKAECNKFVNELFVFMNKELSEFWCRIMSMDESTTQLHGFGIGNITTDGQNTKESGIYSL